MTKKEQEGRIIIQTSLNLDDEFEKGLYDHVLLQGNKSKYLKRLIFMDKEGLRYQFPTPPQPPKQELTAAQRKAMKHIDVL